MPNIQLQDLTATITGTSRYNGGKYDTVHVETLLVTTEPLPAEWSWYVPAGVSVPPEVLALFKAQGLEMYPTLEANLVAGTEDIHQQAEQGNLGDVELDAAKLMMRAIMKKTPLTPLPDASNAYLLSYDYKIYPVTGNPNAFDFKIRLPFNGLGFHPQGGRVQVSVMTPIGARVDGTETKGIDENGNEIGEDVQHLPNSNRQVVNFGYQVDPDFTVRYVY